VATRLKRKSIKKSINKKERVKEPGMVNVKPVKLRKIGGSHGIVIPKQVLSQLGVEEGAELFFVNTPGGVEVTPFDPDFARVVQDSRRYMRRHRNAMRELAGG
jgi:putative addiction module antidote